MSTQVVAFELHVPVSDDGQSDFAVIADLLDALSDRFAYNSYAYAFLLTRAEEARKIEEYTQKNPQDVELFGG